MTYDNLSEGLLDYYPCRYGKSKLLFRGPRKKLDGTYVTMLGGSETYGKFIEKPFPALVEGISGIPCVNFGCVNAGIDAFQHEPVVIDASVKARVTVIQVMGAQNMSNRFYAVHPRRNDRFLRASTLMKTIYREVDFTEFHFTGHLLKTLRALSSERFALLREEVQKAWVARMMTLLQRISGKTILLWLADHRPEEAGGIDDLTRDPLFVTRPMLDRILPEVTEYVEVVPTAGAVARGTQGMVYSPLEEPAAREMLGIGAHEEAALALAGALRRML